jgi:Outer membrane protein (OmpH-like).
MKEKLHYAIEAVLVIAMIILFVLQFSGNKKSSNANSAVSEDKAASGEFMPVAYIDIDSLLVNYTYSIDLNEQMVKKMENAKANLVERSHKFEAEAADFQRKYETNAFISPERAKSEYDRIMKKQAELQNLEAQLQQELGLENMRMNEEIRKTIITQLREYNKGKNYQIIYGKMNDNILYSNDAYNITTEVIEFLNKQHAVSPALTPGEK